MKKKVLFILILLVGIMTLPVSAKNLPGFYSDTNIKVNKDQDRSIFAAGQKIEVNSKVDGASFVAGEDLKMSGSQDLIFAAGETVTLDGTTTKDAFIAGRKLAVKSSNVRDLYAAGETITIDSNIGRNVFVGGDNVIINSTINGNVYVAAGTLEISEKAVINGTLKYNDDAKTKIAKDAMIAKKQVYKSTSVDASRKNIMKVAIANRIRSFLSITLIALILMYTCKKLFASVEKIKFEGDSIIKTAFKGLCFLFILPIVAILLMVSTIGFPIGIISLLLYGILLYLSIIPTSYFIGNKLLKDKIKNEYLLLIISLAVLKVLMMIPKLGGLIGFITVCLGLGIFVTVIKSKLTIK